VRSSSRPATPPAFLKCMVCVGEAEPSIWYLWADLSLNKEVGRAEPMRGGGGRPVRSSSRPATPPAFLKYMVCVGEAELSTVAENNHDWSQLYSPDLLL
jgi:hypothetical protein